MRLSGVRRTAPPARAAAAAGIERGLHRGHVSSTGFLGARAAGPEGNPGFSNHNSTSVAMHPFISPMRPKAGPTIQSPGPFFRPFLGHNAPVLLILDTSVRPWSEGL